MLATWDHDLEGAGSLTDEHWKKSIHGDSDWICAHFQRDHQSRILWDQKRKLNVNCNQMWKAVVSFVTSHRPKLRETGGIVPPIIRWENGCFCPHPQYLESVIANWHSKRDWLHCFGVTAERCLSSKVRILTKFSEKFSNDKICNCTAITCSLLIGYQLTYTSRFCAVLM